MHHRTKRSWGLRARLATGLGVLFVAILGLIAYSHFQYLDDRRDARLEDMQRVSQTVAASLDSLTYDLESLSLSTAITLGDAGLTIDQSVNENTRQTVNEYLAHLFESYGLLRAIFVTDTDGLVVYDQGNSSHGHDVSDRNYIRALQAGETEYWSGGFPGSESGEMVVTHSRTITNSEGNPTGYLVVALMADSLATRLPAGLTDSGHVSIIDKNGTLVLRVPGDEGAPIGENMSDWAALGAARTGEGFVVDDEPIPLGTGERYASLVTLDNLGWVVAYSLPASAITGGTTDLFLRDIAVLGAVVVAAFGAMWLFSSQTVQPLTRLTAVARAIAEGSEAPPHITSGGAEVTELAETMGYMRDAITEREAQLRSQAATIEALEHLGESLASELDVDRAIRSIIEAGVRLVNADAAQFVAREHHDGGQEPSVAGPRPSLALSAEHPLVQEVLGGAVVEIGDAPGGVGTADEGAGTSVRSVLGVPVRSPSGSVEGALLLLHADANVYNDDHQRLATGLARWAGIVLENARLYRQSQELVAELAKSNEAKSEFIGIVSHELRTPITTIYGGALLLRLRRESLPEQAFNDMIVSISEESERLHHLVEDLLAIARTDVVREPRLVDIKDVLQATIGEFSTTRRRVVELNAPAELPPVMADPSYLRQVVSNLISNADKYTDLDLPIEVQAAEEDGELYVRVKDNGPGIDDAELQQVFESFYRSKGAAERASGSGLGLTVCKRLIESLGGRIWAQNRPEGGLEVGFALKARRDAGTPGEEEASSGNNGNGAQSSSGTHLTNESVS